MRQVLQQPGRSAVTVEEVPWPAVPPHGVLVRTVASVVSPGTERDVMSFSRSSLLEKARRRPDLVRQVLDKARRDGVRAAYQAAMSRLARPTLLGYSSAGIVIATGPGVTGLAAGDRVACAGAGHAVHAEVAAVPAALCATIPRRSDGTEIPFEEAAFTCLGAIALHGVRLAQPTLGERAVVIGLGIVGQLAVQLLRAHGCAVYAMDLDGERVRVARELGADAGSEPGTDDREGVARFTRDRGADLVIVAAATPSNAPIELAGEVSRLRGRVVVIGNVGLTVPRRTYYEREVTLTVSRSYGPGRYDPAYEERGLDYPAAYVRWTEGRNMEAFLDAVARGQVRLAPLITHRFPIERAAEAFALLEEGATRSLGIVIEMDEEPRRQQAPPPRATRRAGTGAVGAGVIGAGAFATSVLLPVLQREPGLSLRAIAAATGPSATATARRFGFERVAASADDVLDDPDVGAVFVLTRHAEHAELVVRALERGKHVYVEKPLCVTPEELREITQAYERRRSSGDPAVLAVGFNRRFAPLAARLRAEMADGAPALLAYRVSAGRLPEGHWLRDPAQGGRIVGEACHFIDLASYLVGSLPVRVHAGGMLEAGADEPSLIDVTFADGSALHLVYTADGSPRLEKERLEVFQGGRTWVLDDWRSLTSLGDRRRAGGPAGKGHREEVAAFARALRDGPDPIELESLAATTLATFAALESFRMGVPVEIPR